MKIAIIGTGISGLSIGQMLKDHHNVTLLENKPKIGGLIKCERINDCLFHKVGGHVFNTKNPRVFDWFWSFFNQEEEFIRATRNAKIYLRGQVIGYPIENFLYKLDSELVEKIIEELISISKQQYQQPFDYSNFEAFLIGNFGETLYKLYFEPYNQKIWQTDLKEVAMEWLEGKLPMPNFNEIIRHNILRETEGTMVHSTFYYPKNEGSQFIVNRLSNGLDIRHSYQITEMDINHQITINNDLKFDKLIFTGDIRNLPAAVDELLVNKGFDLNTLKSLKSNGTSNLFCETDDTKISWLYIPENFTKAHRIIYTGNFSPSNNRGSARKTCVVEFSGFVPYEVMVAELSLL
ncbi:MAG: NAD(P)-binding protein, partial [Opitutaceae bacterium]|nr:NAD(P)-binding protein [Cytophagales bacterium]